MITAQEARKNTETSEVTIKKILSKATDMIKEASEAGRSHIYLNEAFLTAGVSGIVSTFEWPFNRKNNIKCHNLTQQTVVDRLREIGFALHAANMSFNSAYFDSIGEEPKGYAIRVAW
jgi:hypothetical protein